MCPVCFSLEGATTCSEVHAWLGKSLPTKKTTWFVEKNYYEK